MRFAGGTGEILKELEGSQEDKRFDISRGVSLTNIISSNYQTNFNDFAQVFLRR